MPPLPPWEGAHVLVVHFPIALLLVTPVFLLLAGVFGTRSLMLCTLLLAVLGTVGAWVAFYSGGAAMDYMADFTVEGDAYDLAYEVLEEHEFQGAYARNLFTATTALYAVVVGLVMGVKKLQGAAPRVALHLLVIASWVYPSMVIANAAHAGGRLVHEFGAKSILAETVEEDAELLDNDPVDDQDEPVAEPEEGEAQQTPETAADSE